MPVANARFATPALSVALAATALLLAGCGSPRDVVGSSLAMPGQYTMYKCPALKVAASGVLGRRKQLQDLMAKAGNGPGGRLVSVTTYEPEDLKLRGQMNELRRAVAENHCSFDPEHPVPAPAAAASKPGKRASKKK